MKHVKNLAGMILIGAMMEYLVIPGESLALASLITGMPPSITLDDWLHKWGTFATITIATGLATFLLWYAIGIWSNPDFTAQSSKRPIWIVLLIFPLLVAVSTPFLLPDASSKWLAVLFLGFNAVFTYWLVSAGFSPSRVKTAPVAGEKVRKVTDALPF